MGFGTGGGDPGELLRGALIGLGQGIASIGLNYVTQELGILPLLANMGFSVISLGIESMFSSEGIFEHMFGQYKKNALTMLGDNPMPDKEDYWYLDINDMWKFNQAGYDRALGNYYWMESVYYFLYSLTRFS